MNHGNLNMTVADLLRVAANGVILARRDFEIMKSYGITRAYIDTLETDKNRLRDTPTDEELQAVFSEVTRDKDHKADLVRTHIRAYMVRAKNVFGADSPEMKGFNAMEVSRMSDNELVRTGRAVKRMSQSKLDVMATKGLTAELVEEFSTQVEEFDRSIDDFNEASRVYHEATANRHELALKVYNQVSEIFDYGKNYWRGKSELRFADYVIFDTPHGNHHPKATGTLHGRVTHAGTGMAIGGALLELPGANLHATTDANGNYVIMQAPVGMYTLTCSASGMKLLEKANTAVTNGNDTGCDLQMSPE